MIPLYTNIAKITCYYVHDTHKIKALEKSKKYHENIKQL